MSIAIRPFEAGHSEAIAAFNRRMAAGGSSWRFPERVDPSGCRSGEEGPEYHEFFLALDGKTMRGGYGLQHRRVSFRGEERPVGVWYHPISEGLVDARHALVAIQLLRHALGREPLCFGLGMEGPGSLLSKLAASLGCEIREVPFFVRIQNGQRFAREARYLRRRPALAWLLDAAAATGAAGLGAGLLKALRRVRVADTSTESVAGFGPWADELWQRCRSRYSFALVRDAKALKRVYPARRRARCIRVVRGETTLGWAVLDSKPMSDHHKFGNLHVGRIADCLAAPEDADAVVQAAVEVLASEGVDVILSNQMHPVWCRALRRNAFLRVPSSFLFATSRELTEAIRRVDPEGRDVHLCRSDDGGGPLTRAAFSARRVRAVPSGHP